MLNEQLKSIWTECFDPKSQVLAPLYFDDIISGGVACVGMNPSFDERTINRFLREFRPNKNSNARQLFSWTGPDQDISSLCIEEQMYAKRTIQYYQFHREIFESSNLPWYQLDLYRYRASKQLEMDEVCKANPHFSKKSLELFNDALRIYQPKAILVLNAAVVRKFESTYECKYDEDHGHHWVRISYRWVPAVFSGQIVRSMATPNRTLFSWYCKQFLARLENGDFTPPE